MKKEKVMKMTLEDLLLRISKRKQKDLQEKISISMQPRKRKKLTKKDKSKTEINNNHRINR